MAEHADQRRGREGSRAMLDSDALRSNLEETAVGQVAVDPKYEVLQEAVSGYRGIQKAVDALLFELHHPFKNWEIILPELRAFALKNFATYSRHAQGLRAMAVIFEIFLDAVRHTGREVLQSRAIDYLLDFIEKIAAEPGPGREGCLELLQTCFRRLALLPERQFVYVASSHTPLKRIGQALLRQAPEHTAFPEFSRLLVQSLEVAYGYWLREEDPQRWMVEEGSPAAGGGMFEEISHCQLGQHRARLKELSGLDGSAENLRRLLALPGFREIVRAYKEIPHRLGGFDPAAGDSLAGNWKIKFLFRMMEIEGLQDIHEETLREINFTLTQLIRREAPERMEAFLLKTFSLLKSSMGEYPQTALQCIQTIGAEIFQRGYSPLVEIFLEQALHFGFQYPRVQGVNANWQLIGNPAHLMNVRVWLDLIGRNPKWCSTLLSALIINLKLGGTCIRDTDLFQKEVTKLLNAEIEPVYNLVKQLTKLLPVYFNEIGAEGLLRDVTTEIDEISARKDPLIHFLRKQSHVESSNLLEKFIEEIFRFWRTRDKGGLSRFLPPEIFDRVETEGPFVDGVQALIGRLLREKGLEREEDLLRVTDPELEAFMAGLPDPGSEKRRVVLLIKIYRLINQKYNLGFQEIRYHLQQASRWGFEGLDRLQRVLDRDETEECLEALLTYLEELREIIVSPQHFEATEDIYRKRHIAADIPSMYGRYREKKFDALGLTFRLENLANVYFERLIDSLDLSFITRATLFQLIQCIRYFFRAMQLDGISSIRLDTHLKLLEKSLEIKRFSFTQYLDIFRGFSEAVKDILSVYYVNAHKANLTELIQQMGTENLLPSYLLPPGEKVSPDAFVHRIAERFLRDLVSGTFGLQYLDNFLARIQQTLAEQKETLDKGDLDLLMTYDPKKVCCPIHQPNRLTYDLIHLGSKGHNLAVLALEGVPVPPGFIVTTEVFRCLRIVEHYKPARDHFRREIRAGIQSMEQATGREYGSPSRPLLLAVRSGATISMPGMMSTILNVGINEEIVEGLARSTEPWFAWDNYRRFIQSWGMSFGMERDIFSDIMNGFKSRYDVVKKRQFSPEQMKRLALAYRQAVEERQITIYEDPWAQLDVSIHQVLRSWEALKARQYREIMGISDAWGTAVIVQAMVFGNLGLSSGSGVVFTAHPYRKIRRVELWGDFTPGNQGEDIVGGLVATHPISREQKELEGREGGLSLEEGFPEVYRRLFEVGKKLVYEKKWNPQEVEFTFEGPRESDFYILQTRDMVSTKRERFEVFQPSPRLQESFIGKGIGVSGGALCGRVVFTPLDIQRLRVEDPGTPLILVRSDTVPDDIQEISLTDGLLTAKGGQTSHAAIVAFELDKTAVVGCHNLVVLEDQGRFTINRTAVHRGDYLSLDGRKGLVFLGRHEIQSDGEINLGS